VKLPFGLSVSVPWAGLATSWAVTESQSTSVSLARTPKPGHGLPEVTVSGSPASTVYGPSAFATGASLTGVTRMSNSPHASTGGSAKVMSPAVMMKRTSSW
jgi:hypothetical protein